MRALVIVIGLALASIAAAHDGGGDPWWRTYYHPAERASGWIPPREYALFAFIGRVDSVGTVECWAPMGQPVAGLAHLTVLDDLWNTPDSLVSIVTHCLLPNQLPEGIERDPFSGILSLAYNCLAPGDSVLIVATPPWGELFPGPDNGYDPVENPQVCKADYALAGFVRYIPSSESTRGKLHAGPIYRQASDGVLPTEAERQFVPERPLADYRYLIERRYKR